MFAASRLVRSLSRTLAVVLCVGAVGCADKSTAGPLPLKLVTDIPLGAPTRRFDYESLDPKTGLLFVADLAGGRVLVADVHANRLVKVIPNVAGVHGVLAVPEQGRVYASATGTDEVVTIDERTLAVIGRGPSGHYPDGIAWEPTRNKLYVSDESGKVVGVIDAATNKLLRQIPMGGEVGNTQFDRADGLIYSNEQSTNELVAIDPASDKIAARWPLPGCIENHGLLIDAQRQLAYIACQGNAKLLVYSLKGHTILSEQPIGPGPDVLSADFGLSRIYVAGEAGVVSIFDISAPTLRKLGEARLADNAHIVAADPVSHRVYFPLRNQAGQAVLRVMEPSQ
jgi:YVTN family beta-propeller protein